MKKDTEIFIDEPLLSLIKNQDDKYINELYDFLMKDCEDIINKLLTDYCDHRTTVSSFNIDKGSLALDSNGKGGFFVSYDENLYQGCKDLNKDEEKNMTIDIELDLFTGEGKLIGDIYYDPDRGNY